MEGRDERLDPVRSFAVLSLKLDPKTWRDFVCDKDNQVMLSSVFNTRDHTHLFLWGSPQSGLSLSINCPQHVQHKVVCVSKKTRGPITAENVKNLLFIQEITGDEAMSFICAVSSEVTCPLLNNPEMSVSQAAGAAQRFMSRQNNEALVMMAQIDGQTFLPHPDALHDDLHDALHDDHPHGSIIYGSNLHHDDLHVGAEGRKLSDGKLLHACDSTIIEWAELVSEFLQQDSSQPVLDGLKPLPSDEFNFWKSRLKNLLFIQQQLQSSRAQQLASTVQQAESVYWSTLKDIYRDVQEGLREAEDVVVNLSPVQEKLEEVEQLEYQQLGEKMAVVMEEVRQLWIRSEFYCKPCRVVVLLQEVCSLLIHKSRKFLRGEEVMLGVLSDPAAVLEDVRLVIRTLQSLKQAYRNSRRQLEQQKQDGNTHSCWDFPSHLVFFQLDNFLLRLQSIQEALSVSLQLHQLDQTVLSGLSGRMWTQLVQEVYQDFLHHVTVLSNCTCDPTDPDNQSFQLLLDQFQIQVSDLERRLVSILRGAFRDCSVPSSASKLVQMFGFLLDRPLIRDQLRPLLEQLVDLVLEELDQTELLFLSQRDRTHMFSRFTPTAAAALCWTRQLRLRAQDSVRHSRTIQYLDLDSDGVLQRWQQMGDVLQDFRDSRGTDWSVHLDSVCGFILDQPLIEQDQQGMLGVSCSRQLEELFRELRYVSKEPDVELHPHAARLFTCREDITQSYLSLSHMASCYNQVLSDVLEVELSLIQNQLQDVNQTLSELQRNSWSCEGVQQLVEQHKDRVLMFHSTVSEARSNMDAITNIIQGWAELQLLQRSGDSLLEGGATEQIYRRIREEGQELLRLTQVNRRLYEAEDSSESWIRYQDHMDDRVQEGLLQLLLRSLHFLSDNMNPQRCSGVLLGVSLQLQETGSVFEPSVGSSLRDFLKTVIFNVYTVASLPPRISMSRYGNYQASLQQHPELAALEQEVMCRLQQVEEEAELLRAGFDRYSHLWKNDRRVVLQEFLTYSRQLAPDELEATETPPTLRDFHREIESLHTLSREVTHLDDVIVLHSWLQVDLRPFRDSLLSLIQHWRLMYTEHLLDSVRDSLQQVTQRGDDDEESSSSSSSFPPAETLLLLGAVGVELPERLSAQLQC